MLFSILYPPSSILYPLSSILYPLIFTIMTTRCIIGLSSGSSADGVDAALLEMDGAGLEVRARPVLTLHQPYHGDLRELVRRTRGSGKIDGK